MRESQISEQFSQTSVFLFRSRVPPTNPDVVSGKSYKPLNLGWWVTQQELWLPGKLREARQVRVPKVRGSSAGLTRLNYLAANGPLTNNPLGPKAE